MSSSKLSFAEFYYGLRVAYQLDDILALIEKSPNFAKYDPTETTKGAQALMLFDIGARTSWLVRTNKRIYKVLDDRRDDRPTINWSISAESARNSEVHVLSSKQTSSGKLLRIAFSFRPGREYLVDPKLFQGIGVEAAIESFIRYKSPTERNLVA